MLRAPFASLRCALAALVVLVAAAPAASAGTIAVGSDGTNPQACAVQADGTVACWGAPGGSPATVPGVTDAVDVAGNGPQTCAVRAAGGVLCWTPGTAPTAPTGGPSDAVAVGTGSASSCAIRAGGTVSCWGQSGNDQLGGPEGDGRHAANAIAVASGDANSCVIARGGAVSCWGKQTASVASDLTDAVSISSGDNVICAVRRDGRVVCWGRGLNGELAMPFDPAVTQATIPGITDATRVAVGGRHVCALRSGGTVSCWGQGSEGQLGQGTPLDSATPVAVSGLSGATDIAAGATATCARLGDGSPRCWGDNAAGLMGTGKVSSSATPVTVSNLTDATAVAGNGSTRCAMRSTGAVVCWGDNSLGQLGDGSSLDARPVPGPVSGISTATGVAVGSMHACAVLANTTVRCWGLNVAHQLGDDSAGIIGSTPAAAVSDGANPIAATQLTAMDATTCAVLGGSASVACWGDRFGTTATTLAGTTGTTSLVAGSWHACAIVGGGTVKCWGANWWGMLGNGTQTDSQTTPVATGITDATELRTQVGGYRTCAKRSGGNVWCWGLQPTGIAHDDAPVDTGSASFPTDPEPPACSVVSGQVRCAGLGDFGELGDGYQPAGHYPVQPLPAAVPGLTGVPSWPGTTLMPDGVSVGPTSLAFPTTAVGPTSLPQTVTVTNTAGRWLSLFAAVADPSPASEFGVGTTCGAVLAPGASCTASYVFHPTTAGDKAGSATIELAGRAHTIALSGSVSTGFLVSPGTLTFAPTIVGRTAAGQTVVVTNVAGQTRTLGIAVTGLGPDFRSSTTCGDTLAPGATCTVTFTFAPTAPGARTADAVVTLGGTPNPVALSGTGVPSNAFTGVPSNAFTLESAKVSRKTRIALTLVFPGTGKVKITTTIKSGKKKIAYASTKALTVKKAGTLKVTLTPGKKAKAALKKAKKAKVSVSVSFTPTGGAAAKKTKSVTVTGSKRR